MNQREQFEAWYKKTYGYSRLYRDEQGNYFAPIDSAWEAWQAADAAKDAELQELRAKLAKCREFMEIAISPNCVDNYFYLYLAAKEACGL